MIRPRTLLVAANDDLLDSVADWMARDGRFDVVGRVQAAQQAIEQIEGLRVDLVLMDVTLPDLNGFEACRRIKAQAGAPLVVLSSFFDSQAVRLEAWAAGADGVVAKPDLTEYLTTLAEELVGRAESTQAGQGSKSATTGAKFARVFDSAGGDTGERGSS